MIARAAALALALLPAAAAGQERVASLGGSVTEIVAALGEAGRLVGRDTTSTEPPSVRSLPDLGYVRALSPEGVLSVRPDLILAEEGAGPPATLDLLKAGGIPYVTVPDGFDADGLALKITTVADALGVPQKGAALAGEVRDELAAVTAAQAGQPQRRVLFVLSTQGGRIMAGGRDTAADAVIRLAGGVNAVDGFSGYKTITDEALAAAAPDVILMMDRGASDPSDDGSAVGQALAQPALAATPAGRAGRVVRMDGLYLLGFGPRTPAAVRELAAQLASAG